MLYPANPLLLKAIQHEKMRGMMHEVQIDRMVNQIEHNPLPFRIHNILHRSMLTIFGKRFEHHHTPAA